MKMPKPLYDELYGKIAALNINMPRYRDHLRTLAKPPKDVEKRLRWDLLYSATDPAWVCDNLYPLDLDDTHIDTALKRIVKELETR